MGHQILLMNFLVLRSFYFFQKARVEWLSGLGLLLRVKPFSIYQAPQDIIIENTSMDTGNFSEEKEDLSNGNIFQIQ